MKRTWSVVICIMLVLSLLVGCGSKTASTPEPQKKDGAAAPAQAEEPKKEAAPKPVTLTLGIWPEDNQEAERKMYEDWKKVFEEKYPHITVKPDHYKYSPETFVPKAESGQLPTIYESWFTEPQKIIANGYAADITDIMVKNGWDKAMNPSILKMVSKDGRIYAMPRDGYSLGLYVNVDLYKKAGLVDENGVPKYPKTFDELAQTARTIKDKTGKAGMIILTKDNCGGWHFSNIAWAFGAEFEKQVDGKWVANLNSQEVVDAMQYVKDLKWKYDVLLPNALLGWGDWIKYFGTEQAAMCFAGGDVPHLPVNDYKLNKDHIGIAPIPAGPKGQYSLTGGTPYMFANNATPEEIDAAFKFLEVMGRVPKVDEKVLEGREMDLRTRAGKGEPVGPQPLQIWQNKEYADAITAMFERNKNVNMAYFQDFQEASLKILRTEEPYNCQDLYAILDKVLQKVLTDKNADPRTLLDAANKEFQDKFMSKVK